jgi:hypothetical protein
MPTSYAVASFCLCLVSYYTSKTSLYLLKVYFISLLHYLILLLYNKRGTDVALEDSNIVSFLAFSPILLSVFSDI